LLFFVGLQFSFQRYHFDGVHLLLQRLMTFPSFLCLVQRVIIIKQMIILIGSKIIGIDNESDHNTLPQVE
jgi:hypothetical protein